jgi:hypothetical protein
MFCGFGGGANEIQLPVPVIRIGLERGAMWGEGEKLYITRRRYRGVH